jgi:uncharacterized membrane protein
MSDLVILAFDHEDGALQLRDKLASLQKQHIFQLEDAAIVIWRQDGKAKVKQAVNLVGAGPVGGAFWGMLIGLIFWMPWLGAALDAGGAFSGAFSDIGVSDEFIKEVGNAIEPGHSALFLLVSKANRDQLTEELEGTRATVIQTSLSNEDEARLRALFSADEVEA